MIVQHVLLNIIKIYPPIYFRYSEIGQRWDACEYGRYVSDSKLNATKSSDFLEQLRKSTFSSQGAPALCTR